MADLLTFIEFSLRGLMVGAVYALMAMGLSLIFGVMRVVNVAHGEFLMLGGYVSFFAWSSVQLNPIASLFIATPVLFFFGMTIQRLFIERVVGKPELSSLMLCFGLSIILLQGAQLLFTPDPRGFTWLLYPVRLLGWNFPMYMLMIFATSMAIAFALFLFLKATRWGKAIRAVSQNYEVAQACGIDARKVRMLSFGCGAAMAGAAGAFVPVQFSLSPGVGHEFILKSFAVVVVGGLGSLWGAFLAGLLLGIVESLITFYFSSHLAQLTFYATIIAVLLVRPGGLFGSAEA